MVRFKSSSRRSPIAATEYRCIGGNPGFDKSLFRFGRPAPLAALRGTQPLHRPGYDLRTRPDMTGSYEYGMLPQALFDELKRKIIERQRKGTGWIIPRE